MNSKNSKYVLMSVLIICGTILLLRHVQQSAPSPHFFDRIADADRVVLSQLGGPPIISITDGKVGEIVRAITSAKPIPGVNGQRPFMGIGIKLLIEADFYKGTIFLGRIRTSSDLFTTDYSDAYAAEKGTLSSLIDESYSGAAK